MEYQPIASTDSEGNTTTYTYDTVTQRPYQALTPSGQGGTLTNRYQGDAAGTTCGALRGQLCATVDGKGNTTAITYNASRSPVSITPPAPLGGITNTFDAAGRVATSTNGKGNTAEYVYDGLDRIRETRYGATCPITCVTYGYDANGNVLTRVDAAGTTTYTYDEQNRPTSKTLGGTTTSLTWDRASNITSYTDPAGTTTYRYDDADRLVALAAPGGSCPATPVFPNSTKCTGFTYDNNDQRTATRHPNGVTNTTVYDGADRIASITATTSAGAILTKRAYTYTVGANGKDGSLRKTMTTETGAATTYGYDKMNRLTQAVLGTSTEAWTYDANGNRLTATKTGAPTVHSAYNAADQLCWTGVTAGTCAAPPTGAATYTYDANGNTTKAGTATSVFNVFDQMQSHTHTGTIAFSYAGSSNTERTTIGLTTVLNGLLGVTRTIDNSYGTSFLRDPQGNLLSMTNNAGTFYYTTDALGSTIALTDSTQAKAATYTYDSWGNTTATGNQYPNNPFQFTGGYYDVTTGYTKLGARYYNPTIGRFTQRDPSGQDPHHTYAMNNPCNMTDPSGLISCFSSSLGLIGSSIIFAGASATPGIVGGAFLVSAAAFNWHDACIGDADTISTGAYYRGR